MKRCLLLALVCTAALAETPADFGWHAQVQADTSAPYYRLALPFDAYLNARQPGLADLRVFNAAGRPVPFARVEPSGKREEQVERTALRWFPLREARADSADRFDVSVRQNRDGALVEVRSQRGDESAGQSRPVRAYLLDASMLTRREQVVALTLDWQGEVGGFQSIDIEGSDNLQDWQSLQRNVQLARLEFNGERIEHRRIELGGLPARYLRLQWREPASAPVLSRAEIEQSSTRWSAPALAWSMPLASQTAPFGLQAGEFYYQLRQAVPVSRIRLALPPGNALLPLQILQPARERRYWQRVAGGVVYRIRNKQYESVQDEIALDGQWLKEFIVRIDPRSSQAVGAPALQIGIVPEQIVFLAEGTAPYRLAVGNGKTAAADLPLSTLVPDQTSGSQIAGARLASGVLVAQLPATPSVPGQQDRVVWKKVALWGVLLAGVLLMAAMAWQLLRQMKQK